MSAYTPQVVRAAQALCARASETCGVNYDDNWKTYGDDWLADAQATLDAAGAPELLEALVALETLFAPCATDSTQRDWIDRARAAIAKAEGKQA